MIKKISVSIVILVIASCSSVKKNTQANTTNKINLIEKVSGNNIKPSRSTQIINYSGIYGINDASFNVASSAINYKGSILLTDTNNNLIRQIKDNKITTYVGNGQKENIAGQYTKASLNNPENITVDSKKNIYVSVNYNQIKKIDNFGNVTHFAGKYSPGWIDGGVDSAKETASFKFISSLVVNKNDEIYVADKNKIRKIGLDGKVTTIAGGDQGGDKQGKALESLFNQISDIELNNEQELYIVDQVNGKIKKLGTDGLITTFIPKGIIKWPSSIAVSNKGFVLVFDSSDKILYVFDKQGKLIKTLKSNILASQDYSFQMKITVDEYDNVIIPSKDFINIINKDSQITKIGEKNGNCRNGIINEATFNYPYDGVFDTNGNLYVIEKGNRVIRKISEKGLVSTFSGNGKYGRTVGVAQNTSFINTEAVAIDSFGNLYVVDGDWKEVCVKKIDANGTSSVFIDPKSKNLEIGRWNDLVFDSQNNLYVSDNVKNKVFRFDSLGNIIEFNLSVKLNGPAGLAMDKNDNLFICDSNNNRIVKVSKDNKTEIIVANNYIFFDEPENITIDNLGNLYVTDRNRTRIIKMDLNLDSEIFLEESSLGKNKNHNFSEYTNTLKIEAFKNEIYVFDKYDNQISKLK
ncbi:NHL repeat-containing protein [Flavobacterium undicola]|uniref:hypothetical protein n=1 Tax=Flavobacterium undicola TaxID=1932779 RepID=UPI001378140B|nr:hypothetical protein [Flavobacterium undicola]MBA0882886.1 hypothetical protein [Flavobacterium undicola]